MAFPRRLPLWYGACVRAQKGNGIRHFELSNSPLRETPVKQYQTLTSEKYYADKLETEAKVMRKLHAGKVISDFLASAIILLGTCAVFAYVLYMTPFVPNCIDFMRANGILSY